MNELRILIARLGWPSTSSRWWTIQELAARLGKPVTKTETESALLQYLRSCKLEAEVVEVLSIFWMAIHGHGYSPRADLAGSIPKPSLLSDVIVDSCGFAIQSGQVDFQVVPKNFEIPDDFDAVQGIDLPKIYRTYMSQLESYSELPFVRQMAFEWTENQGAYPDVPYQRDLSYFSLPLGGGLVIKLFARTALRAISAYLRTLAVAKHCWNMPVKMAEEYSLLALPLHPTLALLRPQRPDWLATLPGFNGDCEVIEAAVRSLLTQVEQARPGDELIAFNSPVVMSMECCVEVSLVRWSQASGANIDDANLATHLKYFWTCGQYLDCTASEPLSTTTIIVPLAAEKLVNEDSKAWPLAVRLGLDRMGYLQLDLTPSRLFFPTMSGLNRIEIKPCDKQLEVKVDDQVVAEFCYWNAGWGPAHPQQLQGNCGTALISRGNAYRVSTGSEYRPVRSFYLWQVRTLHRSSSYDEFSESLATGAIFV